MQGKVVRAYQVWSQFGDISITKADLSLIRLFAMAHDIIIYGLIDSLLKYCIETILLHQRVYSIIENSPICN